MQPTDRRTVAALAQQQGVLPHYKLQGHLVTPPQVQRFRQSSKQGGGSTKSFRKARSVRRTRHAEDVEGGMVTMYPPPSQLGGFREHRKLPQRGPRQSPGEKGFYYFLSVSERLSLQCLLKICVVHNRLMIGKNGFSSMGTFFSIEATASEIFCSSCVGKLTKINLEKSFQVLNAISQFDCRFCTSQVFWSVEKCSLKQF